jgi:predicted transglutaminase-like cysteine proteinase
VKYSDLEQVNKQINAIPYKSEVDEDWTPITEFKDGNDCDSYATAKMEELYKRGWPLSKMRLATCWVETGEYHAVLLCDLDDYTYVLDNRYPYPMRYDLLKYKWHKLQITGTQKWELA